jgi:hypothetical protein
MLVNPIKADRTKEYLEVRMGQSEVLVEHDRSFCKDERDVDMYLL